MTVEVVTMGIVVGTPAASVETVDVVIVATTEFMGPCADGVGPCGRPATELYEAGAVT